MINKKGFISTSVIYTILIVFLLLLATLLLMYYNNRLLLTELKSDLRNYLTTGYSYKNGDVIVEIYKESDNNYVSVSNFSSEITSDYLLMENKTECSVEYAVTNAGISLVLDIDEIMTSSVTCKFYYDYVGD